MCKKVIDQTTYKISKFFEKLKRDKETQMTIKEINNSFRRQRDSSIRDFIYAITQDEDLANNIHIKKIIEEVK